jgi:hypothetical protein
MHSTNGLTAQISVLSPRTQSGEPPIIANFINQGNTLGRNQILLRELPAAPPPHNVDKVLIN